MEKWCSIWRNKICNVGDLEIQYRVNEDGTLNLRLFNRENDINYIGQGVGYTQGFGVSYEVDLIPSKNWSTKYSKIRYLVAKIRVLNNFKIRI
jgi:hypothetical protein